MRRLSFRRKLVTLSLTIALVGTSVFLAFPTDVSGAGPKEDALATKEQENLLPNTVENMETMEALTATNTRTSFQDASNFTLIEEEGNTDTYTYKLKKGDIFTFDLWASNADMDLNFEFADSYNRIDSYSYTGSSALHKTYEIKFTGTYTLTIAEYNKKSGYYGLRAYKFAGNDPTLVALPFKQAESFSKSSLRDTSSLRYKEYTFTGIAGHELSLQMTSASNTDWQISDAYGNAISDGSNGTSHNKTFKPNFTDTYKLKVWTQAETNTKYSVNLYDKNQSSVPVPSAQKPMDKLSTVTIVDDHTANLIESGNEYKITKTYSLSAGQHFALSINTYSPYKIKYEFYNSSQTIDSDISGRNRIEKDFVIVDTDTYTLEITPDSDSKSGVVELFTRTFDTYEKAVDLPYVLTNAFSDNSPIEQNYVHRFEFNCIANHRVMISTYSVPNCKWYLKNSFGNVVMSDTWGTNRYSYEFKPTITDDYYFEIASSYRGQYNLSIKDMDIAPTAIEIMKDGSPVSSVTSLSGQTIHLGTQVEPSNAYDQTVSWTSSDPQVAKVVNGTVTPISGGKTTITAKTNVGKKTASIKVYVKGLSLSKAKVTVSGNQVYSGKVKKPSVKVTFNGKAVSASNYSVTYKNNKKVGKATIKVKAKGTYYTGTTNASFPISPKAYALKGVVAENRNLTAIWEELTSAKKKSLGDVSGIQIRYREVYSSDGSNDYGTWIIKSAKAADVSKRINDLSSGYKYQVQLRIYKTVGGKKYYSAWSKTKTTRYIE
ncbi:Ig-like domain-containing protein [Lachnospiraceae bacterium ZAX-1]